MATKQFNPFASAFPNLQMPDLQQFSGFNAGGLETLMQTGNAMMKAVSDMNAEILDFTKQRLDAGIEVSKSLAKCTSMQAAMDVQMDFARTETQVYLNEARRIMELATTAASTGLKPVKPASNGHNGARGHKR